MNLKPTLLLLLAISFTHCQQTRNIAAEEDTSIANTSERPFSWNNATVYFLLTDRFYNGNPGNDVNFSRNEETAVLRGFQGGDLTGITQKIEAGYFDSLGVNAIWLTPVVEQIHGGTDEGTGLTYGYHGYWASDWTALDPNFGTEQELQQLVDTAHAHGIRILLDVVANHTGPVTSKDTAWPDAWVRQDPTCTYQGYESTVECTLVDNLPDIHTEKEEAVTLPDFLKKKWEQEDRLAQEMAELDQFFANTGYPQTPRFYLIKWLTDFVRQYGIDGFRVDTAKHTEAGVWEDLKREAEKAFKDWKTSHPNQILDDNPFFMVGEVYGYSAGNGRAYDYGDEQVDFFANGFTSLINFAFKTDAQGAYDPLFTKYDTVLHGGSLQGLSVLNYLTSHDDGDPFDRQREQTLEAGTKLLLSPGAAQIYYGDETARPLIIEGAEGDANLRSFMNWEALEEDSLAKATLAHWSKLSRFRRDHIAVGDGRHRKWQDAPYVFSRQYTGNGYTDQVLVALDMPEGEKYLSVFGVFEEGVTLRDYYSGKTAKVKDGKVRFSTPATLLLLAVQR